MTQKRFSGVGVPLTTCNEATARPKLIWHYDLSQIPDEAIEAEYLQRKEARENPQRDPTTVT